MTATIINPRHDLGAVRLVEPPPYGYLLFGATVTPPKGPPIVRRDATRQAVLTVSPSTSKASRNSSRSCAPPAIEPSLYRPLAHQSFDPTSSRHAST